MNIILIGPPGVGKGTQAQHLKRHWGLAHIATGDMLRAEIKAKTPLGLQAEGIIAQGGFVPDALVVDMIRHRLQRPDCRQGFILDGFPRNVAQAHSLDQMLAQSGLHLDAVIALTTDEAALVDRITGRFTCSHCGAGYHERHKRPRFAVLCDECGGTQFARRPDDNAVVVKRRLAEYHAQTAPVLTYYAAKGLLESVDGIQSMGEVSRQIDAILADQDNKKASAAHG